METGPDGGHLQKVWGWQSSSKEALDPHPSMSRRGCWGEWTRMEAILVGC